MEYDGQIFSHRPVLLEETIRALHVVPDGVYVDGTAGGGGHSFEIAKRLIQGGHLIMIDRDDDAIAACRERMRPFEDRVTIVKENFENAAQIAKSLGYETIHGALLDLGVSSYQLDSAERGFSYMQDAPLDMRMDRTQSFSAADVVNSYDEAQLKRVLYTWGEERYAPQIARAILRQRQEKPIQGTAQLAQIVKDALPPKAKIGGHHPAKRTFQAIRIEVNRELDVIAPALDSLVSILLPGGVLAVITFHSLEDRIAKQTFANLASGCTCPPDFPVCVCGKKPLVKLGEKGTAPSEREVEENPRARSARLRTVVKL